MHKRYQIQSLEKIWSDQSKFDRWLQIEIANCQALADQGLITPSELSDIEKHASFKIDDIYEIEKQTKHDVIAFTRAITKNVQSDACKWIHYGLTSTDVVDTANSIAFKQTNDLIIEHLNQLKKTILNLALKHKYTLAIGRTHGMHAEVLTFGFKLIGWVDELQRQIIRFKLAAKDLEVCMISGAVGTYSNTNPSVQEFISKKLNLKSCPYSTQVLSRDNHAFYFNVLNNIGLSINKFSTELRHLHRTEVSEVSEFFDKNQKGSSAMPHKKNPIGLENICGLSRLLSGYSLVADENVNLWHERDISHSSNERIIFIDATSTLVYILKRFDSIVSTLIIDENKMLENVKIHEQKIFSGRLMAYLISNTNLSREEIYDEIQKMVLKTNDKKLTDILKEHEWSKYVSNIDELFDYNHYIKHIDHVFERVLKNEN
ncbi:MAG: adenylosuccinate lyase [Mycoplasma sp.]